MGNKYVDRLRFGILLFVFVVSVSTKALAQNETCILPTGTGQELVCPPGWGAGVLKVMASSEQVARSGYVEIWVESGGHGRPPYTLEVSGSGFHFHSISGPTTTTTDGDGVTVELWADGSACGSATIVVTDGCNQPGTGYVRCTYGTWDPKGNYCGLPGSVSCYSASWGISYYELVQGNKKQYQATKVYDEQRSLPGIGHCQWCINWYENHRCGVVSETVELDNCIDGDHVVPGLTFCCSTDYYWCHRDGCSSELWECDEGANDHWLVDAAAACIWNRPGYGVQLEYSEWECE